MGMCSLKPIVMRNFARTTWSEVCYLMWFLQPLCDKCSCPIRLLHETSVVVSRKGASFACRFCDSSFGEYFCCVIVPLTFALCFTCFIDKAWKLVLNVDVHLASIVHKFFSLTAPCDMNEAKHRRQTAPCEMDCGKFLLFVFRQSRSCHSLDQGWAKLFDSGLHWIPKFDSGFHWVQMDVYCVWVCKPI